MPLLFSEEVMSSLENHTEASKDFYKSEGVNVELCLKCERWSILRTMFHMYGVIECTNCIYKNQKATK